MIRDTRELVSRQDYYFEIVSRLRNQGAVLDAKLTLKEILEIFEQLPAQDELTAEWVREGLKWRCSYCTIPALERSGESYPSKRCPACGRRMRVKV